MSEQYQKDILDNQALLLEETQLRQKLEYELQTRETEIEMLQQKLANAMGSDSASFGSTGTLDKDLLDGAFEPSSNFFNQSLFWFCLKPFLYV